MRMKTNTAFAIVLFVVVLTGCAATGGNASAAIERANQEAYRGKAQAAFAILRPLAEQGDADAQYALAKIQLREKWRDRDPTDGRKWLLRAAEQGLVVAQFDLARFYAIEEKNYPEALKWYMKVAKEHPDSKAGRTAAENLGVMYAHGEGVARSLVDAERWYRISAERGGSEGQFRLGLIYLEGLAGHKDFGEAIKWMAAAAKQGHRIARYTLIFIYAEGFDTKPNVVEAAYWYTGRRVSDEGEAAYHVGMFYSRGFSAWPEEQRVLAWLLNRRGIPEETTNQYLKEIYGKTWGDEEESVRWYRAGAEAGFVGAQVNLARIYWNQESSYWNCAEAIKWTKVAADKDDPTAMVNMGMFYMQGPKERAFTGIGVELTKAENGIQVKNVFSASSAEAGGVKQNDFIVTVNGKDASELGVHGVADAVRTTSKDNKVVLRVRRGSDSNLKTISVIPRETLLKCPGADTAGLKRDAEEAVRWFEKASDRGDLTGLFYLAQAYRKGTGVPQDNKKALALYDKGASRGDWEAAQAISHMYSAGEGVERNRELANKWMSKAIELKHQSLGRR